jgi:hypothetical protein
LVFIVIGRVVLSTESYRGTARNGKSLR